MINALDAELDRRNLGPAQTVTLPYDEDEQIVLGPEHGCIEPTE
ncbi:MAG: hypothetical protein P9M14_12405 [Candidatus Alcyoniella australis]|nr:hypothetical protein [Candidatus Alcyoniella australis]